MAVRQKQIAQRLGVSITLVSRVLSGRAREVGIAEATIARVFAAAEEMGYVPSAAARTLKGKATNTIGVVVYDFKDPFFGEIIEQLQAQAHENGYSLVLAGFQGRVPAPSDLAPLRKHAIDGLILLGSDDHAAWLGDFGDLPVARIGHGSAGEASVRIAIDEEDAARQMLAFLRETGRYRVVFAGQQLPANRLRLRAFESQAPAYGIRVREWLEAARAFGTGRLVAEAVLAEGGADAIVCANDTIAMGALRALHDAGAALAVTGFDDIPAAAQFIPPITSLRQPIEAMARRAFQAVTQAEPPGLVHLPGTLVCRRSA